MAWGTDVMMLGRLGSIESTDVALGAVGALGAAADDAPPVDWAFLLGSYTGAWLGGAGVGYVVGQRAPAAVTGGMAASGIWGLGETLVYARDKKPWLSLLFLGIGGSSLYFAWHRAKR